MVGEYDDQLRWPFVGKINIEILNWRENKGHHKKKLSIVSVLVLKLPKEDLDRERGDSLSLTHL